jgi:hypothetical protein
LHCTFSPAEAGHQRVEISALRGRMTAKEGPSSFTLVSANISWRFVRLDLKSCFEVHLAMYEVGCYW